MNFVSFSLSARVFLLIFKMLFKYIAVSDFYEDYSFFSIMSPSSHHLLPLSLIQIIRIIFGLSPLSIAHSLHISKMSSANEQLSPVLLDDTGIGTCWRSEQSRPIGNILPWKAAVWACNTWSTVIGAPGALQKYCVCTQLVDGLERSLCLLWGKMIGIK